MPGILRFLSTFPLLVAMSGLEAATVVSHKLELTVDPERGALSAKDTLILPTGPDTWTLLLHKGLDPEVSAGNAELTRIGSQDQLESYRLRVRGSDQVTLRYGGHIRHGLEEIPESMGRSRQWTRGTIGEDGVVLDGSSGWYPRIPGTLQTFDLEVRLPPGWSAVSQGAGPELAETSEGTRVRWREEQPQDDIYLIAAPFDRYSRPTPHGEAQVYLREPDADLADRYLSATADYLALYSELIGPYPYAKFALVENFWETGYGMPSFTLLGPRVIRLPFIIDTSYPHEVLHNWWGNGVYVDYEHGNWSEGLTAYLSDHLLKERRGLGAEYRRDTLKSYADYVRDGEDFPIRAFRGRHSSASQAIGYGKTLMMLHMLRRDLGDAAFLAGLRRFYRDNLFRTSGFEDLRRAFERESGRDLTLFFAQWTERTGAPDLALSGVTAEQAGEGFRLRGRIEQSQDEDPFPLRVPLLIHLEGGGVEERLVEVSARNADFDLSLPSRPVRVAADPRFDLFRRLAPGESPPTLSAIFGSDGGVIVLPAGAPPDLAVGYRELAAAWAGGSKGWEVVGDGDLTALPSGRPVWLLGRENRFVSELKRGAGSFELEPHAKSLEVDGKNFPLEGISTALVQGSEGRMIGWVAASDPAALPGLARKLPHYGKYSYLVFEGQEPQNRLKGQWPAGDSRLTLWLTAERPALKLPPEVPLTAVLK